MNKKVISPTPKILAKGNAITKACAVLTAISEHSPLRLNEISEATGLNRVTALRILDDLAAAGFVQRHENPPRYDFGPEMVAVSAAASRSVDITALVRPSLLKLADSSRDTVLFSIRSNTEAICVDRVTGDYPIRANFLRVGSRRSLGIGGGSMALLAALPVSERKAIMDITLSRTSEYPLISAEVFDEHLEHYRKLGYVVMYDIVVDNMAAIGIPIVDRNGHLRGSISIVALSDRIRSREKKLVEAMRSEVDHIVKKL